MGRVASEEKLEEKPLEKLATELSLYTDERLAERVCDAIDDSADDMLALIAAEDADAEKLLISAEILEDKALIACEELAGKVVRPDKLDANMADELYADTEL